MQPRDATPEDALGMSAVLDEIFQAGKRHAGGDVAMVMEHYIENPDSLRCTVMEDADGRILGFQSLKRVDEGNIYNAPAGWGVIGTHIRPSMARMGIGKALFAVSKEAARAAALRDIEAQIGRENAEGVAYYEAMGFRTYRYDGQNVCKGYKVE